MSSERTAAIAPPGAITATAAIVQTSTIAPSARSAAVVPNAPIVATGPIAVTTRSAAIAAVTSVASMVRAAALAGFSAVALAACSSGSGGSDVGDHVDFTPTARPQVLNGGAANIFREGAEVLLTGKASEDRGGPLIHWRWEQASGPTVRLIEAGSAGRSFTAPPVDTATELTFRLTVEDSSRNTDSATIGVTVIPARDSDKFLSLDITSGLTFDTFKVVAALAGGAATGSAAKAFTLRAQSFLVYPPRSFPGADCTFDPADFAGGVPAVLAGGCRVEPLGELTPGASGGLQASWPAGVEAPHEDAVSMLERWWNPRFALPIPRLDVREFNQRFVDAGEREQMLDPFRADAARIVLQLELDAPENQSDTALIVTDLTDTPLSLPLVTQGSGASAEVIANAGDGLPTRVIAPLDTLLAAIAGRESALTSAVYYRTVDPLGTRLTLNEWLVQAGFAAALDGQLLPEAVAGTGEFAHAVYVNNFDLGFGRQMYTRTDEYGNVFSFVQNYSTLEAAIRQSDAFVTVVMEYSPLGGHADPTEKFVKFFTYIDDGSGNERRVSSFDFDGRGERFTPGNCTTCHGGAKPPGVGELIFDAACGNRADAQCYAWPQTNRDGDTIADGNLQAMFLPWDLDSLLYADTDPAITAAPVPFDGVTVAAELQRDYGDFSRAAQTEQFRRLNQAAYETYDDPERTGSTRTLLEHWYGGVDADGLLIGPFDGSSAIAGWLAGELVPDPNEDDELVANPDDAPALYLDVHAQHCRMCHSNHIDPALRFDTYREFVAMEEPLAELVFGSGSMPGARLTMDRFWSPFAGGMPPGLLLGAHVGELLEVPALVAPGTGGPVIAGLDPPPHRGDTVYLSGAQSLLANSYAWQLAAPPGSAAALIGADGSLPLFVVDEPGDYAVTLTVNAGELGEASTTTAFSVGNLPPVGVGDVVSLHTADGVLAASVFDGPIADYDPEGDVLTAGVAAGGLPAHGTLSLGAQGTYIYTFTGDPANPPAADAFSYTLTDPYGGSTSARVTILLSAADGAQRPSPPLGLSARDASAAVGDGSAFAAELSWQASSDDVQVLGYNVYRDGELLAYLSNVQAPGTDVVFLDDAAAPDASYVYYVTAVDAQSESLLSPGAAVRLMPSLRQNIQSSWGAGGDTLWQASGCVGCHRGAAGGLTLRGPGADAVHAEIVEDLGTATPRVNTEAIAASEILCKPLIATHPRSCAHGGGDFLVASDPKYQMLLRWIAAGAPNN